MKAMVLEKCPGNLSLKDLERPTAGPQQVLLRVKACGVCRTDLHLIDGELPDPALPLIPGHEIVGEVLETGPAVKDFQKGDRVGVPWLGWACGACAFCQRGEENLCERARFTGYQLPGGYAQYTVADARFCHPLPEKCSDEAAAPLLCAGLIGYRCLSKAGEAHRIGLYGFGAAAHLITQVALHQGREIFAFTRPGDAKAQRFARDLGAQWAGDSDQSTPDLLDAAIIFAPVGALVPRALRAVRPGGTVICGGIHMSDIPSFPYEYLWRERRVESVANLTRADGKEFFRAIRSIPLQVRTQPYPLDAANEALGDLREGRLTGAGVLIP